VTCVRMRLTCGAECPVHRGSSAPTRRLRCKPDRASRARWSKQCSRRRTPEHAPSVVDRAPESDYFTSAVTIGILGRFSSPASAPTVPSPEPSFPRPAPSSPAPLPKPLTPGRPIPCPSPLCPGPLPGPSLGPLWPPSCHPGRVRFPGRWPFSLGLARVFGSVFRVPFRLGKTMIAALQRVLTWQG